MLITSTWGEKKTFKLIPISQDAPYNECIFDPDGKVLAIVGKDKKESLHMLTKLNEFGDPVTMKTARRANGKDYAEERKVLETFYEYYIETREDIEYLINLFAVNADSFKYSEILDAAFNVEPTSPIIAPEQPKIIASI